MPGVTILQIRLSPLWKSLAGSILHPGPQTLLGTPLCSRSTQRTHHTVSRLSACYSAPGKGRGTCLTAPRVNGWARSSAQSWAPASLKLALQGVKEGRSPGCCSDECPVQGTLKSGRCMLKAGFELHLESGNLRLHSSSNRLCQPVSSGQEPGCSQGFFFCLFRN